MFVYDLPEDVSVNDFYGDSDEFWGLYEAASPVNQAKCEAHDRKRL